jgi:hypothetical protein
MGDARDQVPADLVLVVERVRHVVERGGELAKLTGRLDFAGARGAVAAGHRAGHRDQPGDRTGDPPGDPEAGREREQGGEPGGPGDGPQQRGPQDRVGGAEAGGGQAGPHRAHLAPLDQHGRAGLRTRRRREAAGGRHGMAGLVTHLKLHAAVRGQVEGGCEVGTDPALAVLPRAGRRDRERAGKLAALPACQRRHVNSGEDCREDGDQCDRRQRHAEERECQPQPQRAGPVTAIRRVRRISRARTGALWRLRGVSHRGPGRAGSHRRARSR